MSRKEDEPTTTEGAKPTMPRRWRWRRVLLIVAGLVIALELGLRFMLGLGMPVVYQTDPACGYVPAPNQDTRRFFSRNHINNASMRSDRDISARRPAGTYRVIFIGDSVTYGTTYVDQDELFTTRLGRELAAVGGQRVEVFNASAGAWAVGNEVGYLKSHGTFDANLIVFVLNTGDLQQAFNKMALPVPGYPKERPWTALGEGWSRYVLPRISTRPAQSVEAGTVADRPENVELNFPKIMDELRLAQDIANKQHARFGIVYVPCRSQKWQHPVFGEALAELKAWGEGNGVPVVDTTANMDKHATEEVYWDGTHLKPAGHAVVAETVKEHWGKLAPVVSTTE